MVSTVRLTEIITAFQCDPGSLERGADALELKETHISVVLLSATRVYKFKKPVRFAFLDQESLEERRLNCAREIALNRRLAADVYLGLGAVVARGGHFTLEDVPISDDLQGTPAPGNVLEYCVVMRRLPDERNVKSLLERDAITLDDMNAIARTIGDFHLACKRGPEITACRDFHGNLAEDLDVLNEAGADDSMLSDIRRMLARESRHLDRRAEHNLILDGHGDLRLDHIYLLEEGVRIIDCVEFNPALRAVDPFEDLAFTTMALKLEGRADLADRLIVAYCARTIDLSGLSLLPLYEIYRASVRAKIDWFMLQSDLPQSRRDDLRGRFDAYLKFMQERLRLRGAASRAANHRQTISIVVGLPATGKSTQARRLHASSTDPAAVLLASDVIRKRMLRLAPEEVAGKQAFDGAYHVDMTARVYRRMIALARLALEAGFSVILDASFGRAAYRRMVAVLARKTGVRSVFYHVRAREADVRQRLERRRANGGGISDLDDFSIWQTLAAKFEEFSAEELREITLHEIESPSA